MGESRNSNGGGMAKGLMIGLLAGGALGASIALLYAPKPGRKLRAELKEKADTLMEDGEEYMMAVQEKAAEIVGDAKKGITQLFSDTEKEITRSVKSATKEARHS
ncbi:MAG: putative gas vesicle protein [Bacteroidetes bacterium]|nr:putative gas vesicle protein [Bacteroidota bacterium]